MTMHLVRGMSTTSTKKRKSRNKSKSLLNAEAALAKYYSKLGVGKSTANAGLDIPDYRQHTNTIPTAGGMIGNGSKKESNTYTGTEIRPLSVCFYARLDIPYFIATCTRSVTYTHLTQPTIYSV